MLIDKFYYNTSHKAIDDKTKLRRLENEKLHLFNNGICSISVYWFNCAKRSSSIWRTFASCALRITCDLLGDFVHRLFASKYFRLMVDDSGDSKWQKL